MSGIRMFGVLFLLALIAGTGCQPFPQRPGSFGQAVVTDEVRLPTERYTAISPDQGRVFELDSNRSDVRIYVFRSGALVGTGHNHIIRAGHMQGAMFLPTRGVSGARFDIVLAVQQLEVDPPQLRNEARGAFEGELDPDAIAGTRENMLGEQVLDAERFPKIGIQSIRIDGELPKLIVTAAITLHGIRRVEVVPVTARVEDGRLIVDGRLALRQTDYGITPFSVLGGLLRIQDWVMVEFHLVWLR